MSAVNERGISHIKDEDLLKKMWQETEDFGKKKEIRAHMYKLREERLKDLYCNNDIKDVHLITNKKTSFNQSMHADALADHSFASLKKKEIRDSESPTKEVSYRIKGPSSNEGWNISKIEEHSQDGKKHKYAQSAHTSGTEFIPQGKLDFEAKNSQEVTTFQDGDENNFVKSKGTSSNSFIRQEAVGGDGNSNFRTSSTKSSSSSRTVTESKSGYGDAKDYPQQLVIEGVNNNNQNNYATSKTVTENRSSFNDIADHGRKQIIIESIGSDDYNNLRRSSNNSTSSKIITENRSYDDNSRKILQISDDKVIDKTTKVYTTDAPRELKSHPGYVEGRTKITRETKTLADGTVVTTTKYETKGSNEVTSSSNQFSSSNSFHDSKSNITTSTSDNQKFSNRKVGQDRDYDSPKNQSRYYVEKTHTIPSTTDTVNVHSRRESNVSQKFDTTKNYQSHVDQSYEKLTRDDVTQNRTDTKNSENVRKHTIQQIDMEERVENIQKKENIRKEVVDKNKVQQTTVAKHDVNSVPLGTPIEIEINLTRINDNQGKTVNPTSLEPQGAKQQAPKPTTSNVYDIPQRREPIKHGDEMTMKTKVTDGQYDTTYRTDYTNKKISVEVSPTHDAFARSLRAVSPDRLSSRTNSRHLKNSNSSLRSSSSPEKTYIDRRHLQRVSPERHINERCYSPAKKTPEKFSSTETITYKSRPATQRISPDKNQRTKHSNEIKISSTVTKKTMEDDTIYKVPPSTLKNKPRSSIPNKPEQYTNSYELTTDLDDNVSTYSTSTITRDKTNTVRSNVDSKTVKEFYIHDQNRPKKDLPTEENTKIDKPIDKPLKRTDTYEERCRQILGITTDSNEKRRSSLEKLRKRNSNLSSSIEPQPKTSPEKTEETPMRKTSESLRQKSPTKQGAPLQEFPAQKRTSPGKSSPEKRMPKEPSPTKGRKPSVEGKPIQEYPAQHRKSPGKQESPTRRSSKETVDNQQERKPFTDHNPIQEFPSQIRKTPDEHPEKITQEDEDRQGRRMSPHQKQTEGFPSQKRISPDKREKQNPSKTYPSNTIDLTEDNTIEVNKDKRTTEYIKQFESGKTNKPKSPQKPDGETEFVSKVNKVEVRDNFNVTVESNVNKAGNTWNEKPSKQNPSKESSPEFNNTYDTPKPISDKYMKTSHVDTRTTTDIKRRTYTADDKKSSLGKDIKPVQSNLENKEPKEDSSTEEEEIMETNITEGVVYDIPKSALKKNTFVNTKVPKDTDDKVTISVSAIDKNEIQDEVTAREVISQYVSEDEDLTEHYQVDNEDHVTEDKTVYKTIDKTIEEKSTNRKTPKKIGPIDNDDIPTKNSQPNNRGQVKSKPVDSYDVRNVEGIEIIEDLITTEDNTSTDDKITKTKTVGELVKNFSLKDSKPVKETFKPAGKPTDRRSSSPSPSRKLTHPIKPSIPNQSPQRPNYDTEVVQINDTKSTSSPNRKTTEIDHRKPSIQKPTTLFEKDVQISIEDIEQKEFDSVNSISVDEQKYYPSKQPTQKGPRVSPTSKKPSKPSEEEKPNSTTTRTLQRLKDSKYSPSKKQSPDQDDVNTCEEIDIEIEETIIIESDEETDDLRTKTREQPLKTTKIVKLENDNELYENNMKSEHELMEVELTISSQSLREPREPIGKPTGKYPQKSKKPENIPKEKDTRRPTSRTPSSSSLTRKPVSTRKINKNEDSEVELKNKTSTYEQTKSDSVVTRTVNTSKPTIGIPSKTAPLQKPIAKKPMDTVGRNTKPIKKVPLDINSDSSEAEEEIHTKKHIIETYEGRTPVEEPLVMKKSVSLLYSDDEDDKKITQLLIESEITEKQPITNQKKEKPSKTPKTTTTNLIENEKNEGIIQKSKSPLKSSPLVNRISKKPAINKKPDVPRQTQPIGSKSMNKETIKRDYKQNTVKDIETFDNLTEDETIHLRTNRVDETMNKKKTSVIDNQKPINRSSKPTNVPKISNGLTPKRPSSRNTVTVEKITTKTTSRIKEPVKAVPKTNKPLVQQKNTTTVSSKTKTETKIKINAINGKTDVIEIKTKQIPKKLEESEDSDEESLPDSLNEERVYTSMNEFTNTVKRTQTENIENTSSSKPMQKKPLPSRKIIINSTDRGTVDLQRSISSREPTPDRMCPLPVTSDDEGLVPRYPDKVVEPEDVTTRKRYDRLFETTIHEQSDTVQSEKIMEIKEDSNQRVSEIDRVDNDDDSLLTVDRKINKFLTTAEKLTEKPIVDISQPAPKVERQKFVINDDLKEDDCLLSVSDKVQKFITEAEHLTTHKDTQHRKSVNIEVKSDVSNKINQFTLPHQTETNYNSPRKSSIPRNVPSSTDKEAMPKKIPTNTTSEKIKLDQDVFITTECAEIEKESDLFRTTKSPNKPSEQFDEPEYESPKSNESKPKTTTSDTSKISLTLKKTSIETSEINEEDTESSPSKPRKNSLKEFTPKNRRPSQEDKVILSTVGRLRSNESIKKAKALFDNTEKSSREDKRQEDILNRPSVFEGRNRTIKESTTRKSIDRTSVTPKRLIFSSEKESEDIQQKETRQVDSHGVNSQNRIRSNDRNSKERDVPGYMKPLDRQSKPTDQTSERPDSQQDDDHPRRKYSDKPVHDDESDVPGYMKPLERSIHEHRQGHQEPKCQEHVHSVFEDTREHYTSTSYKPNEDDTPGYMKPLDRSTTHHHPDTCCSSEPHEHAHNHRQSNIENDVSRRYTSTYKPTNSNEDDIPGYMKPLDRSTKHHHPSTPDSEEYRHTHRHSVSHQDHSSTDWTYTTSETPGYMRPLDRSERPEFEPLEKPEIPEHIIGSGPHQNVPDGDIPGYMKPLDRTDESHRTHSPKKNTHVDNRPRETEGTPTKFGVTLKRTDSSKAVTTSLTTPRNKKHPRTPESEEYRPTHRQTVSHHDIHRNNSSTDFAYTSSRTNEVSTPSYMKPLDRSARPEFEPLEKNELPEHLIGSGPHQKVPEGDIPGYMKPLERTDTSHRSHSPKKNVPTDNRPRETQGTPTKFGVTLKRTDSTKAVTTSLTTPTSKKHPLLLKKTITEEEIEDVYELEVLEELLLKFTIYELRRKIRNQIRIVKKLISEGKLEIAIKNLKNNTKTETNDDSSVKRTTTSRTKSSMTSSLRSSPSRASPSRASPSRESPSRESPSRASPSRTSPMRKIQENQSSSRKNVIERKMSEVSEFRLETSRKESFSSTTTSERVELTRGKSPEKRYPERNPSNRNTPERSPERKPKSNTERNSVRKTTAQESTYRTNQNGRPEEPVTTTKTTTTTTNIFKSSLKKTEPKAKTPTSTSQPDWITQRNLKKTGANEVVKKSSTSSTTSSVKNQNIKSSSTQKSESTDLIASSYGIGPTDENGAPLFGLRALRAQNTNGTTKVQGTVISSQYYSETGKEPVGQISVTKYSSDPRDLGSDEDLSQNGDILSVTTTQKYGYDNSPSLKQLTSTDNESSNSQTNRRKNSSKSSTITRKNSVKALTQKFVENAVEVSKSERQSSYPKAGLILRSSSFKNESNLDDDYSEVTAEERTQESVSVKSSSSSKTVSGGTFLRNKTKVTGVQDAISRMKAEDIEYGDSQEDIEAKDLLNKYLGSQVILSGIEGQMAKTGSSSTKSSSFSTSAKSTSRLTTVSIENGKEVKRTQTFEHPLSEEVLETIWDEQTLRYLLDQSTDYEERKAIRARLRLIMAEQEACTELVKQASQDQSSQSIDETVESSKEIVSEGPVTTTKVTRVSTQQHISKKPMSPFAKFRQLDKQNSLNTPPSTPRTPGGSPLFKFTDAALSQSASTIKDRLLHWCRMKTKEYENIQLDNFSSSWADGLAFCALIHHFLPEAFDYHALTPKERRHNFTLAFKVADEKADIAPLLDVDDMVETMRPDWKCVFTYVQSIYRRFKDED